MTYDKQRELSLGDTHYLYYEMDGGVAFREHGTGNLVRYLDEPSLEYELAHKLRESLVRPEAREKIIEECRIAVLSIGAEAHEAAKAKDASDYVAGYQDATVDADEALKELLTPGPQREGKP